MKIAVYAIALNEEKHIERWVNACKGADVIVVADTGSTDKTVELLKKHNVQVHTIGVQPFRFDDARNASLTLVPSDVDVCVSLDLDEVPDPDFFDKIRTHWKPETTKAWVMWDTGSVWMNNNRIHSRHGYRWVKPCHEITVRSYPGPDVDIVIDTTVKHVPDDSKPRSQYLGMLEWAVLESPSDCRMVAYLTREYYFCNKWQEILDTANKMEALSGGWNVERASVYRFAGQACIELGLPDAEEWFLKGTAIAPDELEAWLGLTNYYYIKERWQECYDAAIKVETLTPGDNYISDHQTKWKMHDLLSMACWHLGKKGSAKKNSRIALELNPDDSRLKDNYNFFVLNTVKEYKDAKA